jgi:hypothetical protein
MPREYRAYQDYNFFKESKPVSYSILLQELGNEQRSRLLRLRCLHTQRKIKYTAEYHGNYKKIKQLKATQKALNRMRPRFTALEESKFIKMYQDNHTLLSITEEFDLPSVQATEMRLKRLKNHGKLKTRPRVYNGV